MSQIPHTGLVSTVQTELEGRIRNVLIPRMVDGGLLYGILPENLRVQRVFTVGTLGFPGMVIIREQTSAAQISGHKVQMDFEYSICPLTQSPEEGFAEADAVEYANNLVDILIAKNDRSMGELVYDTRHVFTSPVFRDMENPGVMFAVSRFRFPCIFQTK